MKTVYKNGPPSHLMRASSTENYELRTDYFIKFSHSTCCVIIVQPLPERSGGERVVLPFKSIMRLKVKSESSPGSSGAAEGRPDTSLHYTFLSPMENKENRQPVPTLPSAGRVPERSEGG